MIPPCGPYDLSFPPAVWRSDQIWYVKESSNARLVVHVGSMCIHDVFVSKNGTWPWREIAHLGVTLSMWTDGCVHYVYIYSASTIDFIHSNELHFLYLNSFLVKHSLGPKADPEQTTTLPWRGLYCFQWHWKMCCWAIFLRSWCEQATLLRAKYGTRLEMFWTFFGAASGNTTMPQEQALQRWDGDGFQAMVGFLHQPRVGKSLIKKESLSFVAVKRKMWVQVGSLFLLKTRRSKGKVLARTVVGPIYC